jgi:diadenosine tetraphosphate (Ap4A) HIT family hydrolase
LWVDRSWRLRLRRPSALPGLVTLHTRKHYDCFADLPKGVAVNFGPLAARIERAVESIGDVGRVHMIKSGDGHAHFHVWFYPRPTGMTQFRGALLPLWALILEPAPENEVEQAGSIIASALRDSQDVN